jgi:hypothetical protein
MDPFQAWLVNKGFPQYYSSMTQSGINNLDDLKDVTQPTLKRIGVLPAHIPKMWNLVLSPSREGYAPAPAQPTPAPTVLHSPEIVVSVPKLVSISVDVEQVLAAAPVQAAPDDSKSEGGSEDEAGARRKLDCLNTFLEAVATLVPQDKLKRLFISYAWWNNEKDTALQKLLTLLKKCLKQVASDVFLDCSGDMVGHIVQTMTENLEGAAHAILIGTPRTRLRAAEVREKPNNLQIEHGLVAARLKTDPTFAVCVLAEGTAEESFPPCVALKYPHAHPHAHARSKPGSDCLPLSVDPRMDLTKDFARTVAGLVEHVYPELPKDNFRYNLARELLDASLCSASGHAQEPANPKVALMMFGAWIELQAESAGPGARCFVAKPENLNNEETSKVQELEELLSQQIGASLEEPPLDNFGSREFDHVFMVGIEGRTYKAETKRLCQMMMTQPRLLTPVVLKGTFETAFQGMPGVSGIMALDMSASPYRTRALQGLVNALFKWDLDSHPWFVAALELYRLAKKGGMCPDCKQLSQPPLSLPEQKESRDEDYDDPRLQACRKTYDGLRTELATAQEKLAKDLEDMTLEEFWAATSQDLDQLLDGAPFKFKGKLRNLHKLKSKQ